MWREWGGFPLNTSFPVAGNMDPVVGPFLLLFFGLPALGLFLLPVLLEGCVLKLIGYGTWLPSFGTSLLMNSVSAVIGLCGAYVGTPLAGPLLLVPLARDLSPGPVNLLEAWAATTNEPAVLIALLLFFWFVAVVTEGLVLMMIRDRTRHPSKLIWSASLIANSASYVTFFAIFAALW